MGNSDRYIWFMILCNIWYRIGELRMKKVLIMTLFIITIFLVIWAGALIKCEYLTQSHGHLYEDIIDETYNIGDGYFKILENKRDYARIYCIIDNKYSKYAVEIVITKNDKKIVSEHTVWAYGGSADNIVWPYLWHTSIMKI